MPLKFDFLPKVTKCCDYVKNLVLAGYLIAAISIIMIFLPPPDVLLKECSNAFEGDLGGVAEIFNYILCVAAAFLIVGSIVLVISLAMNKPRGDVYIIAAFVYFPIDTITRLLGLLNMARQDWRCDEAVLANGQGEMIGYFVVHVIVTALLYYFIIVVNSIPLADSPH